MSPSPRELRPLLLVEEGANWPFMAAVTIAATFDFTVNSHKVKQRPGLQASRPDQQLLTYV